MIKSAKFAKRLLAIVIAAFAIWLFQSLLSQAILLYGESPDGSFGQVGDLFNGLISPIIALLSAGLVYMAFIAQVNANQALMQLQKSSISIEHCRQFTEFLQIKQRSVDKLLDGHPSRNITSHREKGIDLVASFTKRITIDQYENEMIDSFTKILKSIQYSIVNSDWSILSSFQKSIIADMILNHICEPITNFEYLLDKKQDESEAKASLVAMRLQSDQLFALLERELEKYASSGQ